jgi:hypothetical protein
MRRESSINIKTKGVPFMSNQLITPENNERVKGFFLSLDRISAAVEKLFTSCKPTLNGDSFFTDEDHPRN